MALPLPILLLAFWQLAAVTEVFPPSQFASPTAILIAAGALMLDSQFLSNVFLSILRLVVGVSAGAILGTFFGIFIAISPRMRSIINPTLGFMAGVPVVIWIPFWITVFGVGEIFRAGLIAIAAFFLVYTVAYVSTRRASRSYFELLQLYEKSAPEGMRDVYLPAASTQLFTAIRLSLAFGWIILFFVEYAVSEPGTEGLGWFINHARSVGRIEDEFAGLFILGVLAFVLDRLVAYIQRSALRWSDAIEDSLPGK